MVNTFLTGKERRTVLFQYICNTRWFCVCNTSYTNNVDKLKKTAVLKQYDLPTLHSLHHLSLKKLQQKTSLHTSPSVTKTQPKKSLNEECRNYRYPNPQTPWKHKDQAHY